VKDKTGREINYLRISVTDRCNCRCIYCMPPEGVDLKPHGDILSLEEIHEIAKYAVSQGIRKIKVTGGEPLRRRNVSHLIELLAKIPGLEDLGMTSNGILLPPVARKLKDAGLQRVNISLDTLDAKLYKEITRGCELTDALKGIDSAIAAGLTPVKINMVLLPGVNDDEKDKMKHFAEINGLGVRFIPKMDLENGVWATVEGGTGGKCEECNRLRLSADGRLRPCLFCDIEYDVRKLGIKEAYKLALENKPEKGAHTHNRRMIQIGG
jgi:cyclic pyranopterin phosphate synthase